MILGKKIPRTTADLGIALVCAGKTAQCIRQQKGEYQYARPPFLQK